MLNSAAVQPLVRGLRLGKWERLILLHAAAPGAKQEHVKDPDTCIYVTRGDSCLVDFVPDDPASRSAARRATYRLCAAGLVDTGTHYGGRARKSRNVPAWALGKGYANKHCVAVWRTALGECVVVAFRHELETGGRIRWERLAERREEARS